MNMRLRDRAGILLVHVAVILYSHVCFAVNGQCALRNKIFFCSEGMNTCPPGLTCCFESHEGTTPHPVMPGSICETSCAPITHATKSEPVAEITKVSAMCLRESFDDILSIMGTDVYFLVDTSKTEITEVIHLYMVVPSSLCLFSLSHRSLFDPPTLADVK